MRETPTTAEDGIRVALLLLEAAELARWTGLALLAGMYCAERGTTMTIMCLCLSHLFNGKV